MKFYYVVPPSIYSSGSIVEATVTDFIVEGKVRKVSTLHYTYILLNENGVIHSTVREKKGGFNLQTFLKAEGFHTNKEDAIKEFESLVSQFRDKLQQASRYLKKFKVTE